MKLKQFGKKLKQLLWETQEKIETLKQNEHQVLSCSQKKCKIKTLALTVFKSYLTSAYLFFPGLWLLTPHCPIGPACTPPFPSPWTHPWTGSSCQTPIIRRGRLFLSWQSSCTSGPPTRLPGLFFMPSSVLKRTISILEIFYLNYLFF